jgi:hypothetical protein
MRDNGGMRFPSVGPSRWKKDCARIRESGERNKMPLFQAGFLFSLPDMRVHFSVGKLVTDLETDLSIQPLSQKKNAKYLSQFKPDNRDVYI